MMIQKIMKFQLKIERKFQKFKDLSFEYWLYALIGACSIQALFQFLTVKYSETWQDKTELELLNDPVFYLGLMLTFMVALLIIRKWKKLNPM